MFLLGDNKSQIVDASEITNIEEIVDTELIMRENVCALPARGFDPQAVRPSFVRFVSECPVTITTLSNILITKKVLYLIFKSNNSSINNKNKK